MEGAYCPGIAPHVEGSERTYYGSVVLKTRLSDVLQSIEYKICPARSWTTTSVRTGRAYVTYLAELIWRREWDSNPRGAVNANTLSRRAH